MHTLEPDTAEQEPEPLGEQAQVVDVTNIFPEQGKPRCIPPIFRDFCFKSVFMVQFVCALSM
jgi:hypothetical protein